MIIIKLLKLSGRKNAIFPDKNEVQLQKCPPINYTMRTSNVKGRDDFI